MTDNELRQQIDEIRKQIESLHPKATESDTCTDQIMSLVTSAITASNREARKAATLKFSGLWGIGGDNNEHVAIYRRVYSTEMAKLEAELQQTTPEETE